MQVVATAKPTPCWRPSAMGRATSALPSSGTFRASALFSAAEKAAFEFALAASSIPNAGVETIATELRRHWSDDEIVEILGVVTLFGFLNRWNDSMATTLEGDERVGDAHLAARSWSAGEPLAAAVAEGT